MYNEITDRIKQIKKQKGLTNEKLAELSGVPLGTLSKILGNETKDPQISTIIKISRALEVSPDYIVSGTIEPQEYANDVEELIKCYQLCDNENKEELLLLARFKAIKGTIATSKSKYS